MKPIKEALFDFLVKSGLYGAALRENRQRDRAAKRAKKHAGYAAANLNGKRATARRRRQRLKIEARQTREVA